MSFLIHISIIAIIIIYNSINNSQKCIIWFASALNHFPGVFTLIHTYSIAFMGCSILTQRHSCALKCVQGVFTQCSHSLKGIHVHSITFRGCLHSLKGLHGHSIAFRGCTQRHSCALNQCSRGVQLYSVLTQGGKPSKAQWMCRPYRFSLDCFSTVPCTPIVQIHFQQMSE